MLNFDNHSRFHSVFHFGCKWCGQIVKIFPHFNFHFVSREQRRLSIGKDDFDFRSGGFSFAAGRKISLELTENLKYGKLDDCWLCRDCKSVVWTDVQLRNHIQKYHLGLKVFKHVYRDSCVRKTVKDEFKCYNCPDTFKSSKSLCRHIKLAHHQKSYDCELCELGFTRKDALERHKVAAHPSIEEDDDGIAKEIYKCNFTQTNLIHPANLPG